MGCLSSGFGPRRGGAGSLHKGIDIYTADERPIIAAASGRIDFVGVQRAFGRTIVITHKKGVATRYAHLSSFSKNIKAGSRITAGDIIGQTGKSGNASAVHLHYEILIDGKPVNPLN